MKSTVFELTTGSDGAPPEPDWSTQYVNKLERERAADDWGRIVHELRDANLLTVANGRAIERLVDFHVQYMRASRHVCEHGAILPAKRAKVGQWNPYWNVIRQADGSIRTLEAELGIAPLRRNRTDQVRRRPRVARRADAYLRRVGG